MSFDSWQIDLAYYTEPLRELSRLLQLSTGEFTLILAVCNSTTLRGRLLTELQGNYRVVFETLEFPVSASHLLESVRSASQEKAPESLMVLGLETHPGLEQIVTSANLNREEYRQFSFPLVLWLTDTGLCAMIRSAPDLFSWADTVSFPIPLDDLTKQVETIASKLIAADLKLNESIDQILGNELTGELELTLADLEGRRSDLSAIQVADLDLVQGYWAFSREAREVARKYFEAVLEFELNRIEASSRESEAGEGSLPPPQFWGL